MSCVNMVTHNFSTLSLRSNAFIYVVHITRTKAYAIETEKSNCMEMLHLLKRTFKESGDFIPFQMRTKHPEAFAKAIKIQTQKMSTNRTIVLNHVGTDAMLYLSHWIENIEGVEDIIPYRTVETDGRFRILVKKHNFDRIRNELIANLDQWIEDHVAPDAHPPFGRYPGDPEVAPLFSDRYSRGDDSYHHDVRRELVQRREQ